MALPGHLFTTAIKEWGIGPTYNPVMNVHRPPPVLDEIAACLQTKSSVFSTPLTNTPTNAGLDRHRYRYALLRDHISDTGPGQSAKAHRYAAGNQEHHAPNVPSDIGIRGTVSAGYRQPCTPTGHQSCLFWRTRPGWYSQALHLQQGLDVH